MLTAGNIRRGLAATLCLLITLTAPARPEPDQAGALPDSEGVVDAYLALRDWVRSLDPPGLDEAEARCPVSGASGVCVILRHTGRVLGTGVDMSGDGLMLRRAAGRALSAVLGTRAVASLPEEAKARVGRRLTIELEVAGAFLPLPGRSYDQIAEQLEPGLDGIAMRRGDSLKVLFPAQMLAANTAGSIERLLPALAVDLGLPARELAELKRQYGVSVYSFRTIHLTQRAPGRQPLVTFRGQVPVRYEAVTAERIADFADSLTDHLITTLWGGDEPLGLMGDYHPVTDTYSPLIAPPRDQALAAFALGRYASVPQLKPSEAERARSAAFVVLRELCAVAEGEADPLADPTACAAFVYAVSVVPEARSDAAIEALFTRAASRVTGAFRPETGFAITDEQDASPRPIAAHGQAMLAGAMARLMLSAPDLVEGEDVRSALDAAWQAVPDHQRITLLPWIGWAETDYARAVGCPPGSAEALRTLRMLLEASRIDSTTTDGPLDLDGGFALTAGRRPRADAQSTRPAAYLACMLRDPALTEPKERLAALGRHLHTMRFLIQLSVEDDLLWAMRTPQRARGGLRAATWDCTQPAAAQALGLLAAAETLISLDTLAERAQNP